MEQGAGDDSAADFWGYLGDGEIADADEDDEEVEEFTPLLFKLPEDPEGLDEAEQIGKGEKVKIGFTSACKIDRSLLNESEVLLLDSGWEIFLWMGANADRSQKLSAIARADAYCQQDMRTANLPMSIVKSGYESSEFNDYFS